MKLSGPLLVSCRQSEQCNHQNQMYCPGTTSSLQGNLSKEVHQKFSSSSSEFWAIILWKISLTKNSFGQEMKLKKRFDLRDVQLKHFTYALIHFVTYLFLDFCLIFILVPSSFFALSLWLCLNNNFPETSLFHVIYIFILYIILVILLLLMFQLGFDLDDAEFDLPTVDKPPTLESILNEVSPT